MRRHRLIERNFRIRQLGFLRRNARRVGHTHQIRIAHGKHHHVARIFGGQLRTGKIVLCRKIPVERLNVHQRPREIGAKVDDLKRTHNRIQPRKAQTELSQVHLFRV